MSTRHVGIRNVAEAAGVSITTVSHVLNNTPHTRTSEQTKQKVRDAARTLGYGPNRVARALRTQRSGLIGLLSEEIATTPHAGRIILGAQEAARSHDLTLVIINVERGAGPEHSDQVQTLLDQQVDGVLYATMFHREVSLPADLVGTPTVLIDARDRAGRVPSAVPDEYPGALAAVGVLTDAGHRRIGFLTNEEDVPATRLRLLGWQHALRAVGVLPDPQLVISAPSEPAQGYLAARELLQRDPRPTALFCYNDRMAMGAYRAAAELGLRIPTDLSVVGFDNQEIIAANLFPALTTVALPHYEMGAWAIETLVRLLKGRGEELLLADHPTLLPCPLVTRDSVAPPSASPQSATRTAH